ncbi:hypothetical protein HGM15179_003792 [Zosterops borbonicus]|uniref:Uncharacterized protein n=1 Tax=Zosterops borbonicus TaxID=364589 RepID=A0A8K1GT22_9PASS|nr:hypothetical protein HGM15179_003792 [Zosterops borbonicus]
MSWLLRSSHTLHCALDFESKRDWPEEKSILLLSQNHKRGLTDLAGIMMYDERQDTCHQGILPCLEKASKHYNLSEIHKPKPSSRVMAEVLRWSGCLDAKAWMGKDVKTLPGDLVPKYSDEQVPSGTYQREESGKRANPGGAQV